MAELGITVFFSCSFDGIDKDIVHYFRSICEGMGIICKNVSKTSSRAPADEAKKLIRESDALIAIATRRLKRTNGKYNMPDSVQFEIGIASGLGKPTLLFVENGVSIEGLAENIGVYSRFDRNKLVSKDVLKKNIASICEWKEDIAFQSLKAGMLSTNEYYSDLTDFLITLKKENDKFTWHYSGTRRLVFAQPLIKPIRLAAWAPVPTKDVDEDVVLQYGYDIRDGSRKFQLMVKEEKRTANSVHVSLNIKPTPKPGEYLILSHYHASPYLNPLYLEDVDAKTPFVVLNSHKYLAGDGVLVIINTKKLRLMFNFPAEYGLSEDSFAPFVGTVLGENVLHVVKSEIERAEYDISFYGDTLIGRLEIPNPMLMLQYGVAWNPPKRKQEKKRKKVEHA